MNEMHLRINAYSKRKVQTFVFYSLNEMCFSRSRTGFQKQRDRRNRRRRGDNGRRCVSQVL